MKCPTCGAGHVSTHPDGEKRCRQCYATWRPEPKSTEDEPDKRRPRHD